MCCLRALPVLAGDDLMALPVIALGGAGLVSVASNEIPGEMTRMVAAAHEMATGQLPVSSTAATSG